MCDLTCLLKQPVVSGVLKSQVSRPVVHQDAQGRARTSDTSSCNARSSDVETPTRPAPALPPHPRERARAWVRRAHADRKQHKKIRSPSPSPLSSVYIVAPSCPPALSPSLNTDLNEVIWPRVLHAAFAANKAEARCRRKCAQVGNDVSQVAWIRQHQVPAQQHSTIIMCWRCGARTHNYRAGVCPNMCATRHCGRSCMCVCVRVRVCITGHAAHWSQ